MKTPSLFSIGTILKQILFFIIHSWIFSEFNKLSINPSATQEAAVYPG